MKDNMFIESKKEHYESSDTNEKLIINLRDLSHTMRALYEGKGSQKRVLIVLKKVGKITQRELTQRLGIQPGSASEVISKLESTGLIVRKSSDNDRRTIDIELTADGEESAAQALSERNQRHEEMFSCLSDSEKELLLSLLEKVNTDWLTRYGDIKSQNHRPPHHHRHGGYHSVEED